MVRLDFGDDKLVWNYSNYSKINPEVAKHFPFSKPRQYQLETVSEILEAINKGYKYIVLEAGTGTGKSAIAATLAQIFNTSYILTITKQLQDQYLNDFYNLGFKLVKGRSNFKCRKYSKDGISQSCDFGRCVVEGDKCRYSIKNHSNNKITSKNTCEYYFQKFEAMNSNVTIANYPYLFLELNYVSDFSKRDLMICDEAHNIESMIMNQLSLEFTRNDLKEHVKVNITKELVNQLSEGDPAEWIEFVGKIKNKYEKELSRIENIERPELVEKKLFMKSQINDCQRFLEYIQFDSRMWIFDYDKTTKTIQFKPLKIDNYAKNTFFNYADICIFMSATILDYRLFAHWLGISPAEIYPIRRKSPFDIKRNPIKTYAEYNMSRKFIDETAPKTIKTVKEILEKHKNEKGVIHTVSTQCRDFLINSIKSDRFIYHDTQNRSEVIDEFKNSNKPLVMVSQSVSEGVDLPGDECRFQIIYKIPYPDLSDKQTALRNSLDPKWYDYKTSLSLVQTHGRGMRFEEDYCSTYFIDNRLLSYVYRDSAENHFIPDTFTEAIDSFSNKKETDFNFDSENFKRKTDLKRNLVKKGEKLENDTEQAIRFYKSLMENELFSNDYYPYLKLSEIYHVLSMFEEETKIIIQFFKSGVYAEENTLDIFSLKLKNLGNMGYFDYETSMMALENEFYSNGSKNKNMSVPPADKIKPK